MLCVARTFLLHPEDARDKPTNCFWAAKLLLFIEKTKE